MPDIARPVPSSSDGSYTRPDTIQARIAEKMKRMPRVDANGRDLPPATADPTVVPIVDPAAPAASPAMQPNPLQGGAGGVSVPTPPIPEGFRPAPPR